MSSNEDFLRGGGEMGALMRAKDWTATPLGVPETWPQGLRTAIRILLNTRHPIFIFWGAELTCFYNDSYRQSLGDERHPSSLGRAGFDVWEEIWPIIGPQIEQVMAGKGATWHENQVVPSTRNGVREDVYWTYSYGPIDEQDSPNGVGGVLVICNETTAQVKASARLERSEKQLQLALSVGRGIGTWDWDVPNDRVYANENFARLYGVDPAMAAEGAPIANFFTSIHPDDVAPLQGTIQRALTTGEIFSEEYRLVRGAETVWVLAEGQCHLAPDGTPLRFPGVSFDISDRKATEQALRSLNTDLERQVIERSSERGTTWQVSPHLLSVIDMNTGNFMRVNPAWSLTLGWSENELVGKPYADFVEPDDLPASYAAFEEVLKGLPVLNFVNRYRAKDGKYCWLSWVAVPEDGKLYSTSRDITEEVERAAALKQLEEALRQSQKMEAVGQLTGGIAHDFNNLLTGISGSIEVLQARISQGRVSEADRYITAAQGAVRRAAALTHRLLAFSRRQTLDPKPVNVNRLVSNLEELVRRTVGPAISVEVFGSGGLWITLIDQNQLENALLNLCINGRDAMPDGGRLKIETANNWFDLREAQQRDLNPGQYVALSVTDTGAGMTPDVVEKAFDPFFTTKPLGEGTGLGLSMIYGFARQSGGQVRIYSEVGKGTTVTLFLPRHDADEMPEGAEGVKSPTPQAEAGETVLVVDDEPTIRMLVAEVLEENGYQVREAADAAAGLRILETSSNIQLLVTDVGLPGGMNGRQLADVALARQPNLKVLFITGYADSAVIGNGQLAKGMQILTKPFEMDALARKIKSILAAT